MSTESLTEVVQKLGQTFNNLQIRESSYFNFYDETLIIHGFPPNLPTNKQGLKQFIHMLWQAFPDIKITFEDIIVEGNKAACRYNLTGTHKGEFSNIQPTDRKFKVDGMTIFSFRNAKCIERWNIVDIHSLMEQLGVSSSN